MSFDLPPNSVTEHFDPFMGPPDYIPLDAFDRSNLPEPPAVTAELLLYNCYGESEGGERVLLFGHGLPHNEISERRKWAEEREALIKEIDRLESAIKHDGES